VPHQLDFEMASYFIIWKPTCEGSKRYEVNLVELILFAWLVDLVGEKSVSMRIFLSGAIVQMPSRCI